MKRRKLFVRVALLAAGGIALSLLACVESDSTLGFETAADAAADSTPSVDVAPSDDTPISDASAPFDGADEPVTCTTKPCVTQLVAGSNHFCALLSDHTVHCWGYAFVEFGHFDAGGSSHPTQPRPRSMGLSGVTQITAGDGTTCARFDDGSVSCWGANYGGTIPLDPPRYDYEPHDPTPASISGVARVDVAARGAVFATKASGELWAWGANTEDQLARASESAKFLGPGPTDLTASCDPAGPGGCTKVVRAGGASYPMGNEGSISFAIATDGRMYTWGSSHEMVAYPGAVPIAVDGLANVGSAAATTSHVCAVADGRLYCWGPDGMAACTGVADAARKPLEIRTLGKARPQQVAVTYRNTCVRMNDGTIQCCGADDKGQLGVADLDAGKPFARTLVETQGLAERAVSVAVAVSTTCALLQGGTVQCWGNNTNGELGRGTTDEERHPIPATVSFE